MHGTREKGLQPERQNPAESARRVWRARFARGGEAVIGGGLMLVGLIIGEKSGLTSEIASSVMTVVGFVAAVHGVLRRS